VEEVGAISPIACVNSTGWASRAKRRKYTPRTRPGSQCDGFQARQRCQHGVPIALAQLPDFGKHHPVGREFVRPWTPRVLPAVLQPLAQCWILGTSRRRFAGSRLASRRDPADRASNQQVRDDCQGECNQKRFDRIDPAQDDNVVQAVERQTCDKDLPDRFPAVVQQLPTVRGIHENGPKIRWLALTAVLLVYVLLQVRNEYYVGFSRHRFAVTRTRVAGLFASRFKNRGPERPLPPGRESWAKWCYLFDLRSRARIRYAW